MEWSVAKHLQLGVWWVKQGSTVHKPHNCPSRLSLEQTRTSCLRELTPLRARVLPRVSLKAQSFRHWSLTYFWMIISISYKCQLSISMQMILLSPFRTKLYVFERNHGNWKTYSYRIAWMQPNAGQSWEVSTFLYRK